MQATHFKREMPGVRYIIAVTSFFCLLTNFAVRVNLNVSIIAMVNSSAIYHEDKISTKDDLSCRLSTNYFNTTKEDKKYSKNGEFLWSPATQGIILGSFYYGYCCFQIVGGRLAEIYSSKWVFAVGTFLASVLAFFTPIAARHSATAIVFVRASQGASQSVLFPSLYALFGHWFPDLERGTLGTVVVSGLSIGTLVGMSGSGFLCNADLFDGWPSTFYIFGFLNCVMGIFWCLLVTNSPITHPWIAEIELKYIISNQQSDMNKHVPPIPWRKVVTSVPFLALTITQVGAEWCIYIILNDLPTYFATVLHFDIEKNGILSSIPFPLKALIAIIVGFTSDAFLRKGYTTLNFTRKFCTVFPLLWFSLGLVGVCIAGCDAVLSTILFVCTVPSIGFSVSGYLVNHLDLSPEYAGTLYGITNTFSSVMGFAAPMFVGYVTNEHQSLQEWYIVFGTVIAVLLFSSTVFSVFGSTKKQNWMQEESDAHMLKEDMPNYNTIEWAQNIF